MNCHEFIDFLADYIEGGLPSRTRATFDSHLEECESCTAYLASYRETIVIARLTELRPETLLDEAPEELIEAILRSR